MAKTVAHVDTTDVSRALSMAFLPAITPYTLESLPRRPTDNDPSSASETQQATGEC